MHTMPSREISTIAIYPDRNASSSPANQLSALAEYCHSLLGSMPDPERERHRILTSIKTAKNHVYYDRGLEVVETWSKGSIRFAWQILGHLKKNPSLRVVHLQHEFNQFGKAPTIPLIIVMMFAIRRLMRRRTVVTFHEVLGPAVLKSEILEKLCVKVPGFAARLLMRCYYRLLCAQCDVVFVQHEDFRDVLAREYGVKADIRLLPLGVKQHPARFAREEARSWLGVESHDRVLVFFGTIDWRKGLDLLLDAFVLLPPGYKLIIAGGQPVRIKNTPEYKKWHSQLMARVATTAGVRTFGYLTDEEIARLFSGVDLVVLPYVIPQRVSAVMNIAASYELPFIGSDAFRGHADPLVLCAAEPKALAEKIEWAFDGHLEELRNYARLYKKQHAWEHSAAVLIEAYRALADQKGPLT
jgi:glycosyltransferase involved in cell wall biosynthesis